MSDMRFAGRGRGDLQLDPVELTGGPKTQSAGAADNVNLGANYSTLAKNSPQYDVMAADQIEKRADLENAYNDAEASVYQQGLTSETDIISAKIKADAEEKSAKRSAAAGKKASTIGAIGTVISAGFSLLSDEETKHTVENIENACDKLRDLHPVTFYYKAEYSMSPERLHHGFIAQEYQTVIPDATYYDSELDKLCIDTGELIALLVRANQELQYRVTRLEAKNALEAGVAK